MTLHELLNSLKEIKKSSLRLFDETKHAPSEEQRQKQAELHAKAKQLWFKLSEHVMRAHGKEGLELCEQACIAYGIESSILGLKAELKEEEYNNLAEYAEYYQHPLYEQILPWCRFAYLSEKNGTPEEHAFKLATLLKSKEAVLEYLTRFSSTTKSSYPVHDACLFSLPERPKTAEPWHFEFWRNLANKRDSNSGGLTLIHPSFVAMLPHTLAIERELASESSGKTKMSSAKDAIEELKKTIRKEESDYKKNLYGKPDSNAGTDHREKRQAERQRLKKNIDKLYAELFELSKGSPLEKADLITLNAGYQTYRSKNSEHELLIKYGISEKSIQTFHSLKPKDNPELIPDVLLDGEDIGYPGYYIRKLNVLDKKDAALAACLGVITNCCQYLGGVGSSCAEHGITSPYGGFYVLCKRDSNDDKMDSDDPVVAQAWVWRNQEEALCFDSVETVSDLEAQQAAKNMYRYLAIHLCNTHNISQVNTGAHSGISDQVGSHHYPAQLLHCVDSHGYKDSINQLALAHSTMPYLLYGKTDSPSLQEIIAKQTEEFIDSLFASARPLEENDALKQIIFFILHGQRRNNDQSSEFETLLQLVKNHANNKGRGQELEQLIGYNEVYIEQLNKGIVDVELLKKGAWINAFDDKGQSALHCAILQSNQDLAKTLLEQGINSHLQNQQGDTALTLALKTKKSSENCALIKYFIEYFPFNLNDKNKDGETALIIAVKNNDFSMVKYLVEHGANIEEFDGDEKTALFLALEHSYTNN